VPIPENIIKQILEKADIRDIVGEYTSLRQKGGRYWGLCPFHNEKTPSFSVTPENGFFYCFGCHKGGTVFNFVMETEHLRFAEAVEFVGKKVGIEVNEAGPEVSEEEKRKGALRELYRRVAGSYHYFLTQTAAGEAAFRYLQNRGIKKETIEKFLIGYSPVDSRWLFRFLEKHGYSREFLKTTGLFSNHNPQISFFVDRVVFPIYSPRGDVIAFGGRILEGTAPKYLNSPESEIFKKGANLYGLHQARDAIKKSRSVIIVEGYMDVVALVQGGIENVVAPLGTAFTPEQGRILKRFADTAHLFFDGDEAGVKAVGRTAEILERLEFQISVIPPPTGGDPADFIKNDRIDELQTILKCPINIMDFLLRNSKFQSGVASPEGKELIIRDLFPYIDSMVSEVKRDAAMAKLADTLEIDKSAIQTDFGRRKRQPDKKIEMGLSVRKDDKIPLTPEIALMLAAVSGREVFEYIRSRVSVDDFEDKFGREIFISLEESFRGEGWNPEQFLRGIENPDLRSFFVRKLVSEEFSINRDRLIKDALISLKKRNLEKQNQEVVRELKRFGQESFHNGDKMTELLEKKMFLDSELEKLRVTENE
jgi:DNA primase